MDFNRGFQIVKKCLAGANTQLQSEIATLEERFNKADRSERLFGSSENVRNERSQIVYSLNELALKYCGVSFNDLCAGLESTIRPSVPQEISTSSGLSGANINGGDTGISGDVVGRDKIVDQSTHGDAYHIHIGQVHNLAIGRVAQVSGSPASGSLDKARPVIDLAAGVVAICSTSSEIVGTGFVVSERLIVTCAHVVEQAGGGPGETINVRFHLNGAQQSAQVVAEWWRAPDVDDIAILRLVDSLPAGVAPLPLGKATGSDKHVFRSLGYPMVGDYVGLIADGVINALIRKADGRQMVQLTSPQLAQGHSGAPVWDEAHGCVIGIVSEVYHAGKDNKNRDTAFATLAETLWQVCPELRSPDDGSVVQRENPFYTNGRINDPALFFDRERLLREIRSELGKRSSISLVGESQVGKSSLLYYLYATRAEWLLDVAIEYIDLQRVFSEADFCKAVLKRIGVDGNSLQDLRDALETREVILLLDEVERIAEADFSPRLHDLLRSLTQEKNFALCVATQRPLEEVFPPRAPNGLSPFHNVFTRKIIDRFAEAEARRFLMQRLQATSVSFTEREISRLIAESQGHPAQLQRLAKELYDQLNDD